MECNITPTVNHDPDGQTETKEDIAYEDKRGHYKIQRVYKVPKTFEKNSQLPGKATT